jgi:SEC-C motif
LPGSAYTKMAKIGRNAPCHCGSGLKYKKCHGGPHGPPTGQATSATPSLQHFLDQMQATECIHRIQQGLGRPIIGFKSGDQQIVAVGNKVYFYNKWKTFPDFLTD